MTLIIVKLQLYLALRSILSRVVKYLMFIMLHLLVN